MAITKIQSESMNLADTYAFTGTVTGAGGQGTNFFQAKNAGTAATFTHGGSVLVPFDSEVFDPDGVFDPSSSNYKFTCQTAGYHIFTAQVQQNDSGGNSRQVGTMLFKNGSDAVNGSGAYWDTYNNDTFRESAIRTTAILNLSVNDYVQVYFYQTQSDGHDNSLMTSSAYNVFTGYRIAQ